MERSDQARKPLEFGSFSQGPCLQNSYKSERSSVYETAEIYGVLLCIYLWATYVPWVWISETKVHDSFLKDLTQLLERKQEGH